MTAPPVAAAPASAVPASAVPIPRQDLTGLILAGGRGSRMGGVDKGLQPHRGQPLAWHALQRLRPQVGALMINANRNLDRYAALGEPVWPDVLPDQPGPLAGFLAGLAHCTTPWLLTVPCDTPFFPQDLAARLIAAVQAEGAELAIAATRELPDEGARAAGRRPEADGRVLQPQPVFCLLPLTLRDSLTDFVASGRRSIDRWTAQHRCATVVFDDAAAFANANTPEELARLQEG